MIMIIRDGQPFRAADHNRLVCFPQRPSHGSFFSSGFLYSAGRRRGAGRQGLPSIHRQPWCDKPVDCPARNFRSSRFTPRSEFPQVFTGKGICLWRPVHGNDAVTVILLSSGVNFAQPFHCRRSRVFHQARDEERATYNKKNKRMAAGSGPFTAGSIYRI